MLTAPKLIPLTNDVPLHGVVGGMKIGVKPNCDLGIVADNVKRNLDVMFLQH